MFLFNNTASSISLENFLYLTHEAIAAELITEGYDYVIVDGVTEIVPKRGGVSDFNAQRTVRWDTPKAKSAGTGNYCVSARAEYSSKAWVGNLPKEYHYAGIYPTAVKDSWSYTRQSGDGWGLFSFPDLLVNCYFQEDLQDGSVGTISAYGGGARVASQASTALKPSKDSINSGILFPANSGKYFTASGDKDNLTDYKWSLIAFKVDSTTGTDTSTEFVTVNRGTSVGGYSSPEIGYSKTDGVYVSYRNRNNNVVTSKFTSNAVIADGNTWNVLLTYNRWGKLYCRLNGQDVGRPSNDSEMFLFERNDSVPSTYIGDTSTGNIEWRLDSLSFGCTDPSEALVEKLEALLMKKLGLALPAGHTYENSDVLIDANDYPTKYTHDTNTWTTWGTNFGDKYVNRGGAIVAHTGYETIFKTDFTESVDQVTNSFDIQDYSKPWQASRPDLGIEIDANLNYPNQSPDMYAYDNTGNGTLTLALDKTGGGTTIASVITTVNQAGHGWTFDNTKDTIFRVRYRLPNETPIGGAFHCPLFLYSLNQMFNRNEEYTEFDLLEPEGDAVTYGNIGSCHVHEGKNAGYNGHISTSEQHYKIAGTTLSNSWAGENGGVGSIDLWDGTWRTWEVKFESDYIYINMSVDRGSGEEMIEVARVPATPAMQQEMYIICDTALRAGDGDLTVGNRTTMELDYIEVLQKTSDLATYAAPFTAQPTISGTAQVGQTLTATPNVSGVTDLRYFWTAGGAPRQYASSSSYTIQPDDLNKQIRCKVLTVGYKDWISCFTTKTSSVIAA